MKILFFSYAYPNPIQPDLGTFNRAMIAGLADAHEVRVVSPVSWTVDVRDRVRRRSWTPAWTKVPPFQAVLNVPATYLTSYYPPKVQRHRYGQWMWWSVQRELRKQIREFQPDVVLSYWTHPDGEVAVRAAHAAGIPAVAMVGGSDVLVLGRKGKRRTAVLDVLRKADQVLVVSDHLRQTLLADGLPEDRVSLIRRGIDDQLFVPGEQAEARRALKLPQHRPMILGVGRLVPVKGWSNLISACATLAARGTAFSCTIIGDGPLKRELQHQVDHSGLSGVVQLLGGQPQNVLSTWYRAADCTVLTSESEGVPNVLLETIQTGKPFIASQVGGIPEIADPAWDTLVPAGDQRALAQSIYDRIHGRWKQPATPRRFQPLTAREAAGELAQLLEQARARFLAPPAPPAVESRGGMSSKTTRGGAVAVSANPTPIGNAAPANILNAVNAASQVAITTPPLTIDPNAAAAPSTQRAATPETASPTVSPAATFTTTPTAASGPAVSTAAPQSKTLSALAVFGFRTQARTPAVASQPAVPEPTTTAAAASTAQTSLSGTTTPPRATTPTTSVPPTSLYGSKGSTDGNRSGAKSPPQRAAAVPIPTASPAILEQLAPFAQALKQRAPRPR